MNTLDMPGLGDRWMMEDGAVVNEEDYDDENVKLSAPITKARPASVLMQEARDLASQYASRIGATDSATRLAAECGALSAILQAVCDEFASTERRLLRALQMAVNYTVETYTEDGHASEVEAEFGIVNESN